MKKTIRILLIYILILLFVTPIVSSAITQRQQDWFTLMDNVYVDKRGIADYEIPGFGDAQYQCTQVMWHYCKYIFGVDDTVGKVSAGYPVLDPDNVDEDYLEIFRLSENPDAQMQPGDIPVWDYGWYGHVGVTQSTFSGGFKAYEQNIDGTASGINQVVKLNSNSYAYLIGWLRPKSGKILPSDNPTTGPLGEVKIDSKDYAYINFRSSNSVNSDVIGELYSGEVYPYYSIKNGWYQIKKNGIYGWVSGYYADILDPSFEYVDRIAGKTRYETAIKIADEIDENPEKYIIASGANFPDALCASNLSEGKYPILLVGSNSVSDSVLNRVSGKDVILLGGKGAVSKEVENKLKSKVHSLNRIGGKTRYETSIKVVNYTGKKNGLILASGNNFPDAMSSTSLAHKYNIPVALTSKNELSNDLRNLISEVDGGIYIVGGKGVISDSLMNEVKSIHPNTYRISGTNRYQTNAAVLNEFGASNKTYVVTGNNFPDSLTASVLAEKNNSPLVLSRKYTITEEYKNYINENKPHSVTILGGKGVISIELQRIINNLCD
ncbi:MAG: hypothetical protein CSB16_00235 [Clostridiales bacterium]|nr:MAG: hypothetical protein CSB16_00235 [Clostridiales bacterium]